MVRCQLTNSECRSMFNVGKDSKPSANSFDFIEVIWIRLDNKNYVRNGCKTDS